MNPGDYFHDKLNHFLSHWVPALECEDLMLLYDRIVQLAEREVRQAVLRERCKFAERARARSKN